MIILVLGKYKCLIDKFFEVRLNVITVLLHKINVDFIIIYNMLIKKLELRQQY